MPFSLQMPQTDQTNHGQPKAPAPDPGAKAPKPAPVEFVHTVELAETIATSLASGALERTASSEVVMTKEVAPLVSALNTMVVSL